MVKKSTDMMKRSSFVLCAAWGLSLAACNDTRDLAPERADQPWQPSLAVMAHNGLVMPPGQQGFAAPREVGSKALLQAHVERFDGGGAPLSLVELIDVAERTNPQTRMAWEAARQAAIGVGLSRAALLPQLTFSAMGGFQRMAFPLPSYLSQRGYLTSNGEAFYPKLELDYLLFDFGQTRAQIQEAQQGALAADYGFTQVHQTLILTVTKAYYAYQSAQNMVQAAQSAEKNAALLLRAAQARHAHGEATVVDVAIAQRNAAQAVFDHERAQDGEHEAKHALLAAMGLPATMDLTVQKMDGQHLPNTLPSNVQGLINQALQARPDVLADLAKLRAADAAVAAAKASLAPRIAVAGIMQGYMGALKTYGTQQSAPAATIAQPEGSAFLQMNWPLYQGGARANSIHLAESRRQQAEAALAQDRIAVEREVADGQDELSTTLAQLRSARVLCTAAQTAFSGASAAYVQGVGTLTDASNAATALYQAQASLAVSEAQAFTNAAVLAHATGRLVSSSAMTAAFRDDAVSP
ncbi:TolC family protein [Neokomagataea thailandica]|nr:MULTISPECIES: TolC family protein [Neokomagataea]